jgi:tRNA-2-methylthio-N6-dimethylallyladenosine synthase
MNVHDSEKIAGVLKARGYSETDDPKNSDVVIFNTCCIRESAEARALGAIASFKGVKARRPDTVLIVVGCVPQKEDSFEKLQRDFKFVDIVLGTHNLTDFEKTFDEYSASKNRFTEIIPKALNLKENASYRTSGANAWVNIMYGCNNFCTYCIVPYVRGRERSRAPEEIIDEVTACVADGYREITLLGQNVNSYGVGLDVNINFAALLRKICEIPGDYRIKFMTSNPKDLTDGVIDCIAENRKLADYIHLPAQSGSTKILAAMNRRYTRESYLTLIGKIREKIPHCGLSSDFIAGFPGETDGDFQDTLSMVREVRFNNIYSFMFSRRRGTVAATLPDAIESAVKKQRVRELIALQREISSSIALECAGKSYRALIEREHGDMREGNPVALSDCGKMIFLEPTDEKYLHTFQNVFVTGNRSGRLVGRVGE